MIDKQIPNRTYGELSHFITDSFRRLGIVVKPGSRLYQMIRATFGADGSQRRKIRESDADYQIAVEAGRDFQQLAFIFDTLPDDLLVQFKPELKKIIRDQPLPQNHNGDSFGRDSQFHLYTAAVAYNAGCKVRSAEPDVVCALPSSEEFCIAAKRVKSRKSLDDRVSEASEQIARAKMPGIIALETSLAFNPDNDRVSARLDDDDFVSRYRGFFDEIIDRNTARLQKLVNPWWVCGIVFHDSIPRVVGSQWEIAGLTLGLTLAGQAVSDASRFWRGYERGIPNLVRSPIIVPQPRVLVAEFAGFQ